MLLGGSGARIQFPTLKANIRRSAAITQNQWYDLWTAGAVAAGAGSVKTNIVVRNLSFDQATANEDLEIRIIADDVDETLTQTAVAGTNYYIIKQPNPDQTTDFYVEANSAIGSQYRSQEFSARKLQIMYRKTTATGANNTTLKLNYSQVT